MNAIQSFAIEVWNDLRGRRLLPVAALLLAGLVAAPMVLSKQAEEPAPAAPEQTAPQREQGRQGPEELAQVRLDDELDAGTGSSLSAFDESNPFAPPQKVLDAVRREAQGGDVGSVAPDAGAGTGTGTDTGGGTAPDTGGGTAPDTGGGTPDTGGGDDGTETTEFTYVLDVTFWSNGRKRTVKGMEKLDMLPSEAAPLLIFMGVTDSAGNAVFLVDSTLETAGEGKCKPSRSDCAFLYLGAGSEQEFTNDEGDSYRLLINEIRRVKVGDESGTAATGSQNGKSAHAAVGAPAPARRFALPTLTDLVVESVGGSDNSTGADERR